MYELELKKYTHQLMRDLGINQASAAVIFKIAPARVSVLCNGKPGKFSEKTLRSFCELLGVRLPTNNAELAEYLGTHLRPYENVKPVRKPAPTRADYIEWFNDIGHTVSWRKSGKGVRSIGQPVLSTSKRGYRKVTLRGVQIDVHRVLWTMRNRDIKPGEWIDHIDGDKLNNSVENLRICSPAENNQNKRGSRNNTPGVKNVTWNKKSNKWQVSLCKDGKSFYMGLFEEIEDATAYIESIRTILHGDFSNSGDRRLLTCSHTLRNLS